MAKQSDSFFKASSGAGASSAAGAAGGFSGSPASSLLNALPSLISTSSSILAQTQAQRALRSFGSFQQQQFGFQSRLLNLDVRDKALELRKQAIKNSSAAQAIFAQRGVRGGVGTALSASFQPFRQAEEDIDTLKFKAALGESSLIGTAGIAKIKNRTQRSAIDTQIAQTATNFLESL